MDFDLGSQKMIGNFKNLSAAALVLAAVALPGLAHAGTANATGTSTLGVVSMCSLTGATVSLGSYTTTQTWNDVAAAVGYNNAGSFWRGSLGSEYLNYGSVMCDAGASYYLRIDGAAQGVIKMNVNGKVGAFQVGIKRLGNVVVPDSNPSSFLGMGAILTTRLAVATGSGDAQAILGSAMLSTSISSYGTTAAMTDKLTTPGTYSDSLTYTLFF